REGRPTRATSTPKISMTTSFTRDVTIFPKAPPTITPTAMSTTLPRRANFLNSCHIPSPLNLSRHLVYSVPPGRSLLLLRGSKGSQPGVVHRAGFLGLAASGEASPIHQDQAGAGRYANFAAGHLPQGLLARPFAVHHHDPACPRQAHTLGSGAPVEQDYDLPPAVAVGMILEHVAHHLGGGHLQEFKVPLDLLCGAHAEGRVGFAQLDQAFVVLEHIQILQFALPIQLVHPIGGLIAVAITVLGAQKILPCMEEGNALGSEDNGAGHLVHLDQLFLWFIWIGDQKLI